MLPQTARIVTVAIRLSRRAWRAAGPLIACVLLLNPAGAASGRQAQSAWSGGRLYVPAPLSASGLPCESPPDGRCAGAIKPGRHPVIVFLHGCDGLRTPHAFLLPDAIVVAPDSFAAGARCTFAWRWSGALREARLAHIAGALERLRSAAWADPSRLLLAGYSHGAQIAAIYPGHEFKARIIIAWTCHSPFTPELNGIRGSGLPSPSSAPPTKSTTNGASPETARMPSRSAARARDRS